MRVLHIGGAFTVTSTLVKYQLKQGVEISVLGAPRGDSIFLPPSGWDAAALERELALAPDVVQFNCRRSLEALIGTGFAESLEAALSAIRSRGAKIVYYSYGWDALDDLLEGQGIREPKSWTRAAFDHFFLASVDNHALVSEYDRWSWLALPVDLEMLMPLGGKTQKAQNIRIIHIAHGVPESDSQVIKMAASSLQGNNYKFSYRGVEPSQITNVASFLMMLSECDLFIEQISQPNFGQLGIEAMALGKPIMSGNAPLSKVIWPQLGMCPVLDVNHKTIHRQLENVIKQPVCLRDLTARSRGYIETYHNAEVLVANMVERYRRLLAR